MIDSINISLNLMFDKLREQEGIKKGKLCNNIEPIDEYAILMNRKYKLENNIEPNDLETEIAIEEGNFIRIYIVKEFYDLGLNKLNGIPFPEHDITIDKITEFLDNKNNSKIKM